jgi:hypothetical protein
MKPSFYAIIHNHHIVQMHIFPYKLSRLLLNAILEVDVCIKQIYMKIMLLHSPQWNSALLVLLSQDPQLRIL